MTPPPTVPPGIDITETTGPITETHNGGVENWLVRDTTKYYTNAFITGPGKILLGYKKRGFGKDMYNGFGGKVEPQESSAQAAVRELEEEAGIVAPLKKCGILYFTSETTDHAFYIDMFTAKEYTGTIVETDEMRPKWFATSPETESADLPLIPYDRMWEDDLYWMPLLLADKSFIGRADFDKDGKIRKWWFAETQF